MTEVTRPAMADDSGDFISGTEVDKAFIDLAYDQIDDQCHSITNPDIKPKDTTDEVVEARGSLDSLDERLSVVLNDDGTLKTQATLVTNAIVQTLIGSRNVAKNGDFDDWTAGASAAPDNWTLNGVGALVARTGPGEADTFSFGAGRYAARVTRVGNDASLEQIIVATADIADYAEMEGRKISMAVKTKTAVPSQVRIVVDDGATTTASTFNTGSGVVEHLTVTHTISASATKLHVLLQVLNTNGAAYFGGVQAMFADLAPSDWQPLSHEPSASATVRGVVDLGTQSFAGTKTFLNPPQFEPGDVAAGAETAIASGVIDAQYTNVGNVGAAETDLMSYTIPAGVLSAVGKTVKISCAGVFANNGANKQIRVYAFGATPAGTENLTYTNKSWYVEFIFVRAGADSVNFSQRWHIGLTGAIVATEQYVLVSTIGGINFSAGNLFKLTGDGTNNDDITQVYMVTEALG